LGTDFLSVDSSSTLNLNKIKFKTYAKYDTNSDTIYSLKVLIPKKAQDFISSLPDGLFTHFQGGMEGTFDYELDFKFNKTNQNN
jgi:hypothetical protein